jgi:DNA-binding NarL/FixJ family response regulator
MPNRQTLTLRDVQEFLERLRLTVEKAEHFDALEKMIKGGTSYAPSAPAASAPPTVTKRQAGPGRKKRGRRAKAGDFDNKIVEVVKASAGGLGSPEIAKKLGIHIERAKYYAQKLKAKGLLKVVGKKRQAKYLAVG